MVYQFSRGPKIYYIYQLAYFNTLANCFLLRAQTLPARLLSRRAPTLRETPLTTIAHGLTRIYAPAHTYVLSRALARTPSPGLSVIRVRANATTTQDSTAASIYTPHTHTHIYTRSQSKLSRVCGEVGPNPSPSDSRGKFSSPKATFGPRRNSSAADRLLCTRSIIPKTILAGEREREESCSRM